ncbi:response regulator [Lysinibacillus fusiformis]|uniref:Response regulator receiver domain-containing protein n=1 Tax=Lysinibacillus fusiformis TaxID=28031 RepID=A0A1H9JK59_9BACI|nr:response regulator [Lysinibacillus fusiformis]SCY43066.1 Response regulator receiver domain-containing protein [Lysinibacillus fusiformis]SEN75100.1 Response regulator receiver domain-containing protein [Lysinibacillus fusiformis]SEQ87200.1 Response regulator receiver domain-containing protein [Lysinibacillus fusiformis]
MRILIIEDDQNKRKQLVQYLNEIFNKPLLEYRLSYKSGLKEIISENYDLIILDMSMPTFDITNSESGGKPLPFAGKEILRQMKRRGICVPTIVVTQFERFGDYERSLNLEELKKELEEEYEGIYLDTVYYNPASSSWRKYLFDKLSMIKGNKDDKNINS